MKNFNIETFYASRKGYESLLAEYHGIDDEFRETTKAMGVSDSMDSDLRENPEFMELRVKAMYTLPSKKRELHERLRNCVIIEDMEEYKNFEGDKVIIGSTVTLKMGDTTQSYTISGTMEGDLKKHILSESAPLMRSVLGRKIGDVVQFNNRDIQVLDIKKAEL